MGAKRTIDTESNEVGTVFLGVRLSTQQVARLDTVAALNGKSRSSFVRELIREATTNVSE
jgi:metal-responsive CopG/Arc/MetJ family transcriptional regulator